jgi:hypothetical protein
LNSKNKLLRGQVNFLAQFKITYDLRVIIHKELVGILLPKDILKYFDVIEFKKEAVEVRIFLEEKKDSPEKHKKKHIRVNGFVNEVKFKDFPLRSKIVTLHIRRRRWLLVDENKKVTRDLSLRTPGTRLKQEFPDFLKAFA